MTWNAIPGCDVRLRTLQAPPRIAIGCYAIMLMTGMTAADYWRQLRSDGCFHACACDLHEEATALHYGLCQSERETLRFTCTLQTETEMTRESFQAIIVAANPSFVLESRATSSSCWPRISLACGPVTEVGNTIPGLGQSFEESHWQCNST